MLSDKKLCTKLQETYNANVLKNGRKPTREFFISTAQTAKKLNITKGNQTLISLINNYADNKTPIPKYIAGPLSLTLFWSSKYQLYVYVFGEFHSTNTDCDKYLKYVPDDTMTIETFLEKLMTTTPAFLDVFVEWSPAIDKIAVFSKVGLNRINSIYERLQKCIHYSTRHDKDCDLARLHWVDVRKGDVSSSTLNDLSYVRAYLIHKTDYLDATNTATTLRRILKDNQRMRKILEELITPSLTKYKNFMKKQVTQSDLVQKELAKTFLRKEIEKFCTEELIKEGLKTRELFQRYIPTLLDDKSTDQKIESALLGLNMATVSVNALMMDFYALSRIFKKFNIQRSKSKQATRIDQPESPHNLIIYAGDSHSVRYRKFFDSLGATRIAHVNNRDTSTINNCIDITNFPMPFFNEFPKK
jgi:hypothetical protein